jgi:hypothetical protein
MMPAISIYVKKQISVNRLNFKQHQMLKIGNVGVAAVKNRAVAALGPHDSPARPLTKRYAIRKTRLGKGNRRNLTFTGSLLRNLQVRSVTENRARAGLSTRKGRIKAWINQRIEPWLVFSPKNRSAVIEAARRVLVESAPRLAVERLLGGKQR